VRHLRAVREFRWGVGLNVNLINRLGHLDKSYS
jgi:hypothetical protein